MAYFAVLNEANMVFNCIVADDLATAQTLTGKKCVEYQMGDPVFIGGTWDGIRFSNPFI